VIRRHILPELGHYLVTELRPDDVRRWFKRMRQLGVGQVAADNAVTVLRAIYGTWVRDDRSLPHGIPVPTGLKKARPRKEFTPLTRDQVNAIIAAMPPDARVMVEIEAFYGSRVSEILALRTEDLVFTGKDEMAALGPQLARLAALPEDRYNARNPRLRFQRKLERDRTPAEIKNRRGIRTLPLPQWLAVLLAEQFEEWPPVDGWLFTNPRPSYGDTRIMLPVRQRRPWRQEPYLGWLHQAAESVGVTFPPNQCSHALRHHAVSILKDRRWNSDAIGLWIGDSARTVDTVYGRPMSDAPDRIAAELSAARSTEGRSLRAV
jgi:integrase